MLLLLYFISSHKTLSHYSGGKTNGGENPVAGKRQINRTEEEEEEETFML